MKRQILAGLSVAVVIACGGGASASPVGLWLAKDGAKIRISPCGRNLCGYIAQPKAPRDPETGRPMTDKNNIDPSKRNRPLAGVEILISMQPQGSGKWTGRLYNDDDGNTYPGNLIELDATHVRIEGCSVGVCGGDELTRLK